MNMQVPSSSPAVQPSENIGSGNSPVTGMHKGQPQIVFKSAPAVSKALEAITEKNNSKPDEMLRFFLKDIPQGVVERAKENGEFLQTATVNDFQKLELAADASEKALATDKDYQETAKLAAVTTAKAHALNLLISDRGQKQTQEVPVPLNTLAAEKMTAALQETGPEKLLEIFTPEERKILEDKELLQSESQKSELSAPMKSVAEKVANEIGRATAMNIALDLYSMRPRNSATEQVVTSDKDKKKEVAEEKKAEGEKKTEENKPRGAGFADDEPSLERDDLGYMYR